MKIENANEVTSTKDLGMGETLLNYGVVTGILEILGLSHEDRGHYRPVLDMCGWHVWIVALNPFFFDGFPKTRQPSP